MEDKLTDGGVASLYIGDEIRGLIFRNHEVHRLACRRSNDEIPTRGNNYAGLHFSNHIAAVGRDRPDGADLHQPLCTGRRLWMMKELREKEKMRKKFPFFG